MLYFRRNNVLDLTIFFTVIRETLRLCVLNQIVHAERFYVTLSALEQL